MAKDAVNWAQAHYWLFDQDERLVQPGTVTRMASRTQVERRNAPVPLHQQAWAGGRGTKTAVVWIAELTTVLALESDS